MALWYARSSVGSSVVQTRLHVELAQDAVRAQLLAGEQRVGALPDAQAAVVSSSSSSIPK